MSSLDPRLQRVCDGYVRTVYAKDVAGFLALYRPEARVFDTWGVWSFEGEAQRRPVIEAWFGSLGEERVGVSFDRVQATVSGEMATLTARVVYVALSATGAELRGMQNRLTWVLQLEADGAKILHEHTSVAIGNDLKGMLQRD